MQGSNHIIFYKNKQAVCPICGGLLTTKMSAEIILNCIDCGVFLRVVGFGQADAELKCEEVKISETI